VIRLIVRLVAITVAFSAISAAAPAQELTLYAMCPPHSMNWSSPRSLMFATVANKLTFIHMKNKHSIGHVFIELKNGEERLMAGSVPTGNSNADNKRMLLKEGVGLGILFAPMPGCLETAADLDPQLPDRFHSGRIAFVNFKLSQATYERLVRFLKEYKERGYDKIYNGLNEPRKGTGAGCGTFGLACVEVAGLLHPAWKNVWARHIDIATRLIGGSMGGGKKVAIPSILVAARWAKEGELTRRLDLYDPDLIYKWINATYARQAENPSHTVGLARRDNAKGLVYDCRHVPTPSEPIFLDD